MKAVTLISANSQVQNNKVIEKWDSQLPWQLNNPSPCHWNLRGMPTPPQKIRHFFRGYEAHLLVPQNNDH